MLIKNISKKMKSVLFLATSIAAVAFSNVNSEAATTYYIRTLLDEGNFGIISQVVTDKGETSDLLERDEGVDFSAILDYKNVVKGSGLIVDITEKDATKFETAYSELKNNSNANMGLLFSFPGLSSSIDPSISYTALSSDMARAELVGNTLSKGLNDALAFIKTYTGREHIDGDGLRHILTELAKTTSSFTTGGSGTVNAGPSGNKKGFSVFQLTGAAQVLDGSAKPVGDELIPVNGLRYSDYVRISTTNSEGKIVYGYFPWRMQKGYRPTGDGTPGALEALVGKDYVNVAKDKENMYITWGQLAVQAGVNADLRGENVVDSASDAMTTLIGQGLGSDLTSMIVSVRSMLNLAPIQELILNMGSRASTYHFGVMTNEMYDTAKTVYVLTLIVSLLFLSALITRMVHQKMISTTNIIAKTSLMEGIQDVLFIGVMLAFFPTIFEILLELNYWIVRTFSFSNSYLSAYGLTSSKVLATESLAGFMISSMFLSIDVYINMTYLVRAIIVAFLFAISPIMTVSYAWGPMQKKLYFSYIRELVGNIFMQSFHAITMTFFAGYNSTNMSSMEAIVSTYCFIPVTQMFKQLVIGNTGFAESIGGKLAGQLTNTASGMHKSNVAMKQSKELFNLTAENNAKSSLASFGAQAIGVASDISASALQNNLANAEIGNLNAGNLNTKTGGSTGKGGGSAWSGALKSAGINMVGTGVGALTTGLTEKSNQSNLGEMQMKHSMENIGMGLAQAGIGLGVSSFDAASGNAMVNSGMSSVQQGASQYGQGEAAAGYAGSANAFAKGTDMGGYIGSRALSGVGRNAIFNQNKIQQEQEKALKIKEQQDIKNETRGINSQEMLSAMGATNVNDKTNPIINVKPHENNTNNVTFQADVKKLENMKGDNGPIFDYLQKLQKDGANHPDVIKARDLAAKAGLEVNHGGNGTGVAGDIKNGESISFVVNNIARYGVEIDNGGSAFTVSDNTQLRSSNNSQ